jgi:hypothetical protein
MNSHLSSELAAANVAELQRRAASTGAVGRRQRRVLRRRRRRDDPSADRLDAWMSTITIRLATSADRCALLDLADLDSAAPPRWPVLVAEQDGRLLAARSLEDGASVADPFTRTTHLCELLATHAGGLTLSSGEERRFSVASRLAPAR